MKKMKGVAAMAPPSSTFSHHTLMHDYLQLHKESEGVKEDLERVKHKKLRLLDEVRFLRLRYKHLIKKQSHPAPGIGYNGKQASLHYPASSFDLSAKQTALNGKEAAPPAFDLNHISREEEEALRYEESRKSSMRMVSDEQRNDVKSTICRNIASGNSISGKGKGKRKITWQDQMALRVEHHASR